MLQLRPMDISEGAIYQEMKASASFLPFHKLVSEIMASLNLPLDSH